MDTLRMIVYRSETAMVGEHLNSAQVKYPGTELEMAFKLGGYTAPNHEKVSNELP
jgi:hypothetical protein